MTEVAPINSFGRLVQGAYGIWKLFPVGVEFKDGGNDDEAAVQESVHYKALSDLVASLDASAIPAIAVPDVTFDSAESKMPVELAVAYLQMM
eukprot:3780794-Pyramimonas_sp.AAC.1